MHLLLKLYGLGPIIKLKGDSYIFISVLFYHPLSLTKNLMTKRLDRLQSEKTRECLVNLAGFVPQFFLVKTKVLDNLCHVGLSKPA